MTTLEDILAIDGNRAVYQRLQALLADGAAMAFIGAGASLPLYPLWGQLIEQLADEPRRWGLAGEADKQQWLRTAAQKPLHVAARIHDKLGTPATTPSCSKRSRTASVPTAAATRRPRRPWCEPTSRRW